MALEILYNAIRITKNGDNAVSAIIKDANGQYIENGDVKLVIEGTDISVSGTYDSTTHEWNFIIPKSDLSGRYMYYFELDGVYLDFPSAIYFV